MTEANEKASRLDDFEAYRQQRRKQLDATLDTFAQMSLSELRENVLEFKGDKWLLTYGSPTVELDIRSGYLTATCGDVEQLRIYPHITPACDFTDIYDYE